jgi:hypothetical protein
MVELKRVKSPEEAGSRELPRIYILISATILFAFLSSFFFEGGNLIYGTVAVVIFLTLFILQPILVSKKAPLYLSALLYVIAFAFPFYKIFSVFLLVMSLVCLAFLSNAIYRGRRLIENMLKLHLFRATRMIAGSAIIAVVIFFSATLILSSNFSVSERRVDQIVETLVQPIGQRYIDGFSSDMTVESLLISIAEKGAKKDERFAYLPSSVQKQLVSESSTELQERVEEFLGVDIDPTLTISRSIHSILEAKLAELNPVAKTYWSTILILVVAVSVKSIDVILYLPLAVLILLLYELLRYLGVFRVELETRSKEIILLK